MKAIVQNIFAIASASIDIEGITLIAGGNRRGKTSLLEAIGYAGVGIATPGTTIAAAAQLLREGAAEGIVLLGDDENWVRWNLPSAKITSGGDRPYLSPIASGLEGFSLMELAQPERAKALIDILKAKPLRGQVFSELRDMGIPEDRHARALRDEKKSEADIIELLSEDGEPWQVDGFGLVVAEISKNGPGWDESAKRHETRATELKGAWNRLTGKRWGSAAAPAWRPDGWLPRLDMLSIGEAALAVNDAEKAHLAAVAKSGAPDADRAEKERLAALWPVRHDAHEAAIKAAGAAETALRTAKNKRDATPVPTDQAATLECPCCHKPLRYSAGLMGVTASLTLASDIVNAEEVKAQRLAKAEADGDHSKAETAHAMALRELAQKKLEVQQAADAKEWLLAHPSGSVADAGAQQRVEAAALVLTIAKANLGRVKLHAEAQALHQQVDREIALAKWMGPTGCRATLLRETIGTFNRTFLAPLCETAEWLPVEIVEADGGFEFAYGGRFLRLSKSERFRVRAVLQMAVARIDGSAFVIVDGADILEPKAWDGRSALFRLAEAMPFPVMVGLTVAANEQLPDLAKQGNGRTYVVSGGMVTPMGGAS